MLRRPPRSTRTDTLFPYTTLFRSQRNLCASLQVTPDRPSLFHRLWPVGSAGHGRMEIHRGGAARSEEHTSELQSLIRISYADFCLKKKLKHQSFLSKHKLIYTYFSSYDYTPTSHQQ